MRAGPLNGSPPERHGAGLGPWDSACRHVANQACLSDARGLLRAEMPPACRPRGVSPQGRRRHMPRAVPVHKEPTPHQAAAAALMAWQLGQSQPPGVPIGDHPEAAPK